MVSREQLWSADARSGCDGFDPKNKGLFAGNNTMSVRSGSSGANLWTVDGANNNDVGSNHTILISPSFDAIEEFKIHRNACGPAYGQSGGGQVVRTAQVPRCRRNRGTSAVLQLGLATGSGHVPAPIDPARGQTFGFFQVRS